MLNTRQRIALYLGGGAILVMLLFPPWELTYRAEGGARMLPSRYACVFVPPAEVISYTRTSADLVYPLVSITAQIAGLRLLLQCLAVAVASGLAMIALQAPPPGVQSSRDS